MSVKIGAHTRLFGLLGKPVGHSLSPAMHTAAFVAVGLDAVYLAFEVEGKDLPAVLAGMAKMGVIGVNVTVPHKEAVFAIVKDRDQSAELTGAVNTLKPTAEGWRGYNTDVAGFLASLKEDLGFSPLDKRAAILGAGGAARAAIVGLAQKGAGEIIVANRDARRALRLVEELNRKLSACIVKAVDFADLPQTLEAGDLVVSATPLGLDKAASWPWDMGEFKEGVLFYDMAYLRGSPTALEAQAKAAGFEAASGARMLLMQGAEAFKLWTGLNPPLKVMESALHPVK